jgi:hypothetical protein
MTEPRQDTPNDPQLSRLYREQPQDEPSAAMDQRILAAARQAVAAQGPSTRRTDWWQRWRLPLSLATTVMLTVSLALLVERQPQEQSTESSRTKERAENTPQLAPQLVPQRAAKPAESAPQAQPSAAPAASPVKTLKSDARVSSSERDLKLPSDNVADQATSAVSPTNKAESMPPAPASGASDPSVKGEMRAVPAAELTPALSATRQAAPLAKSRADSTRPPEVWLEEIRALRRAGKVEEATRQLRDFRLAHPDFPLPEEFRQ